MRVSGSAARARAGGCERQDMYYFLEAPQAPDKQRNVLTSIHNCVTTAAVGPSIFEDGQPATTTVLAPGGRKSSLQSKLAQVRRCRKVNATAISFTTPHGAVDADSACPVVCLPGTPCTPSRRLRENRKKVTKKDEKRQTNHKTQNDALQHQSPC